MATRPSCCSAPTSRQGIPCNTMPMSTASLHHNQHAPQRCCPEACCVQQELRVSCADPGRGGAWHRPSFPTVAMLSTTSLLSTPLHVPHLASAASPDPLLGCAGRWPYPHQPHRQGVGRHAGLSPVMHRSHLISLFVSTLVAPQARIATDGPDAKYRFPVIALAGLCPSFTPLLAPFILLPAQASPIHNSALVSSESRPHALYPSPTYPCGSQRPLISSRVHILAPRVPFPPTP